MKHYSVRYSVRAYIWNPTKEEYERVTVYVNEQEEKARKVYEGMEATADVNQIELWEECIDRFGIEEDSTRIALKDTSGEYEPQDI